MRDILLDSLPHPVMLIREDRIILEANRVARETGARVGGYCWRDFAGCEYVPECDRRYVREHDGMPPPGGTMCTFCLADAALDSGQPTSRAAVSIFERLWDIWWLPLEKDRYLHYAINVTEREWAQERVEHLNAVLRAVRNVNHLITQEKDGERLMQQTCDCLVETRGYHCAWSALVDEDGHPMMITESGLGEDFAPLRENLERGKWPECVARAMAQPDALVIKDPATLCVDCPLSEAYGGDAGLAVCLRYGGETYGALAASTPARFVDRRGEERALFEEVGGDIAFALHNIQMEEERERTRKALARANADLRQFVYAASHDLQEPLRTMIIHLQLLERRERERLDARSKRSLTYAVEGAFRMREMIRGLRIYSQVGRAGEPFVSVDCEEVLAEALANLQPAIRESGAVVTHDPLPSVVGNRYQLRTVFQNLIDNALKFRSAAPPRIHIRAERREREQNDVWQFSVRDNGIGIKPAYADHIFDLFYRLHSPEDYAGPGIGLPVCKKIVEHHGGDIWVKSSCGEGSVFYFTVPVKGAHE